MSDASRPLVTIGIPTYNRADSFLPISLGTAVAQDYESIEIIVSDNCSPDDTEGVVRDFSDTRIHYIRQAENLGPLANYQACLDAANGEYFMLLQDDDQIDADFVSTCMRAVDYRTDLGYIRTGTRVVDESGQKIDDYRNRGGSEQGADALRAWFDGRSAWFFCSSLFNTEALRSRGGFEGPTILAVDWQIYLLMALGTKGANVPDVKASFRQHSGELTFTSGISVWNQDVKALLSLLEDIAPREERPELLQETKKFFFSMVYQFAAQIPSRVERLKAQWSIYRASGYQCPPPAFRRTMKRLVPSSAAIRLRQLVT